MPLASPLLWFGEMNLSLSLSRALLASLILGLCACTPRAGTPTSSAQASPSPSPINAPTPSAELRAAIGAFVADPKSPIAASKADRTALGGIYPQGSEVPLWLGSDLRPTQTATAALALLNDAAAEGLDPSAYAAPILTAKAATLGADASLPEETAAFDVSLSLSMMRYLRQFHRGRVNPREIGFLVSLPEDPHDYADLVREAATQSRLKEVIAKVMPPLVQYRALRSMLPKYRALALVDGVTLPRMTKAPAKSIKPGGSTPAPALEILRTRLIAMGDLPETAAPLADPTLYDGEIVEGVKRFQLRHGFEDDGILGKATWAALSVPLSLRLRQIELAMERMRWLPHLGERAFVAVNVPMFRLFAWDKVPESGIPDFEMGVIVGKALNTRTPVFLEEMTHLIFQPYWNVPKSILRSEILPILRRDLGYLTRQHMEMVDGQGDDARVVAASSDNVERLARGELRLRQRPGPKNALGQVKFMFPNDENIYLHSTPAPELFGRARRDFSHGCVRVEDPVALAVWALKDQPEWTREKIVAAMNGKPSFKVNLTKPIRVVIYYVTATVMPDTNTIHFAEDIYKQDPRLDKALKARVR
jgi:murein L,D-transpeptidase YcbB/YkuD